MIDFLKRNIQFVIMLLLWTACGMVSKQLAVGVVAISILLLKQKNYYLEIVLGFFFVLIMSDNRQPFAEYAKDAKNIYIVLMSVFVLFDRKNFQYKNKLFPQFILFFIWGFVAFTQTIPDNVNTCFQKTLSYVLLYLTVPVYYSRVFHDHGRKFLYETAYFFLWLLVIGFILIAVNPESVFMVGRFSGIMGNPNGLGTLCTIYFLLVYISSKTFVGLFTSNELKLFYGAMILSVLLAVSRNTMSSILLFLFFAHFYRMSSLTGFMILIVSAMVYQVINNNLVDILHSLGLSSFLRADTLENGAGRMIAWKFGWKVIQGHFFVGQGFSYDEWVFYANRHWLMLLGHQGAVHNSYLALWINTGIIGLILYMSGFFYTYYKISLRSYFALPMMFAVMFSIMFEAWLMGSLNPFNAVYILVIHILLHEDVQLEPPQKEASLIPVS